MSRNQNVEQRTHEATHLPPPRVSLALRCKTGLRAGEGKKPEPPLPVDETVIECFPPSTESTGIRFPTI